MFKREITMTIPEYLQMVEDEKIKKIKKELNEKQFKRLVVMSLAFILNPKTILAFSSLTETIAILQMVCLGIIIGLPILSLALTLYKSNKNSTDFDPQYQNENQIVDYTETKIDRNWHKEAK